MATGTVATVGLNLRSNPHNAATILDQLSKGDAFTVIGERGNWYQVRVTKAKGSYADGKEGWVYRKDVVLDLKPAPLPPPRRPPEPMVEVETRASFPLWWIFAGIGAVVAFGLLVRAFW